MSIHCGTLLSNEISRSAVFYMNPILEPPMESSLSNQTATHQLASWDQAYTEFVRESVDIGRMINNQLQSFYQITGIIKTDSHPRPGRFNLMRGLAMPGVVVELGNLSHTRTANFLSNERNQNDLANYIAIAISNYLLERREPGTTLRTQ